MPGFVLTVEWQEAILQTNLLMEAATPARFIPFFDLHMQHTAHEMTKDAFSGEHGGGSYSGLPSRWPALSDWAVLDRGSSSPMLVRSGSFRDEVAAYRGQISDDAGIIGFDFPSETEASGRYYGLTGGQLVNPLASRSLNPGPRGGTAGNWDTPRPLKDTPRPILFGGARLNNDFHALLAEWFDMFGVAMFVGGGGE